MAPLCHEQIPKLEAPGLQVFLAKVQALPSRGTENLEHTECETRFCRSIHNSSSSEEKAAHEDMSSSCHHLHNLHATCKFCTHIHTDTHTQHTHTHLSEALVTSCSSSNPPHDGLPAPDSHFEALFVCTPPNLQRAQVFAARTPLPPRAAGNRFPLARRTHTNTHIYTHAHTLFWQQVRKL